MESNSRPQARQAFLSTLNRYRKSGGGRFLIYFDGDDSNRTMPPPGIRVRYSAPFSADDAIIGRLKEIRRPGEVIVVTNDHGLRTRCRNAGAKCLTWQEFSSKMQSRKKRSSGLKDNEPPVDINDWMDYFGVKE